MAARQHSRFVHFVLPWLVGAAGAALYLATLNRWIGFESVDVVSKVAGWDWNSMQLGPVTLLVTWPIRWLPAGIQPIALNILGAVLGGFVLGLLAKCVALLPHDRTREQRQRERSDFGFLTFPLAWVPPLAAAGLLAFQLTFWEHATAMTGEIINTALFAICVFCFLRFRILQEDRYLAVLSFVFGAAVANDWGVIGFCPLFFAAILWAKGIAFFDGIFLTRTAAAGLAGLLFYLVQPLALKLTGQADGTFFELLRTELGFQRQYLFSFPRWALMFCSLTSLVPVAFMGIRWPSTFGDLSAAGAAITNTLFRIIHLAFLAFCIWNMFDPPFSPRQLGLGLPFLHFYFLSALVVGYATGYTMLVFGELPDRKIPRPTDRVPLISRVLGSLGAVGGLAAAAGLSIYSFPTIRAQNGPLVRELAASLVPPTAPGDPVVLVSDDNSLLMLAVGLLTEKGRDTDIIPIHSRILNRHIYQSHHEKRYGARWPALKIEELSDPLGDVVVLQQMAALSASNQLFYLHPSFGFYFESFYLRPTNTVYAFEPHSTNSIRIPPLADADFDACHRAWDDVRARILENPVLARMRQLREGDISPIAAHFSRAFNTWGVELQRRNRLDDATRFFAAAQVLNKENLAAIINTRFNENLRAGRREPVVLEDELENRLGRFRDLPTFLSICGPVDDPTFCFNLGKTFFAGNLLRQAAVLFARATELQPDSLDARLWFANAALNIPVLEEVRRTLAEIRGLGTNLNASQSIEVANLEAWSAFHRGDLPAAEKIVGDTLKQFPNSSAPLQALTDMYVALVQTNQALATVEKLIARHPEDPRPVVTKSAIQMMGGDHAGAIQTLDAILAKDPGFFPALVNRALANSHLGRLDDAEKDYLKLRELAPNLGLVYYHLGEIDYQRRRAAEARKHFRRFLDLATPGSTEARKAEQRLADIAAGKFGG